MDARVEALYIEYRRIYAWRKGQCLFNAINQVYPLLANKLRGTEADPYYSDAKFKRAMAWLDRELNPPTEVDDADLED